MWKDVPATLLAADNDQCGRPDGGGDAGRQEHGVKMGHCAIKAGSGTAISVGSAQERDSRCDTAVTPASRTYRHVIDHRRAAKGAGHDGSPGLRNCPATCWKQIDVLQ